MSRLSSGQHIGPQAGSGVFDFVAALLILLIVSPLLLVGALIVKVFSPGPLIFGQERIGKDERPFALYKLRTMHPGASSQGTGSVTVRNDPRLFTGAAVLRKLKIDELPQLFNVLNGTMSLVGPRPTVREDVIRMDDVQRKRFLIKPGITGLAQISGSTSLSWPRRIEYDLQYLKSRSLWLDIKIIAKTAWLVASGQTDTHPPGDDEWQEQ